MPNAVWRPEPERPTGDAGRNVIEVHELKLTPEQFDAVSRLMYDTAGIHLPPGKEMLVQGRLGKRVRALNLSGFDEYFARLEADVTGEELSHLVDALTTNKTSFFRESDHFDHLRDEVLPRLRHRRAPFRLWSAGCSSGEEPYTLAMVLREAWTGPELLDTRILATDLSTRMLARAKQAAYTKAELSGVPDEFVRRYFEHRPDDPRPYRVVQEVRSMVRIARLNLFDSWPMRGPFQVIFCRNVMIYFDRAKQERLIQRFWEILEPGGVLYVGHSESLSALKHEFRYIRPAVYMK